MFLNFLHYGPEMDENVLTVWGLFFISFTALSFCLFLALGGYDKVYSKVLACLMTVPVIDEMSMVTTD